jgi:aminoglycoside 3-N-acetyltransferase
MSDMPDPPEALPVTMASLIEDFRNIGVQRGMTLVVHTSMRSIGWVSGGPVAVVLALEEALGPEGTLVMPAHTGDLTEPEFWRNPPVPESWWDIIRQESPAFDPAWTPSRHMGAIAECFRTQPGTLRSSHPHASFTARGPHATTITRNHPLVPALGDETPLGHVYDLDGWVLLVGLGYNNNTSLHLAEYRARYPSKRKERNGARVTRDGRTEWVSFEDLDWDDEDFITIGKAFKQASDRVRNGRVGHAEAVLMPQRELVDFGVRWMEEHRT